MQCQSQRDFAFWCHFAWNDSMAPKLLLVPALLRKDLHLDVDAGLDLTCRNNMMISCKQCKFYLGTWIRGWTEGDGGSRQQDINNMFVHLFATTVRVPSLQGPSHNYSGPPYYSFFTHYDTLQQYKPDYHNLWGVDLSCTGSHSADFLLNFANFQKITLMFSIFTCL